MSRHKLTAEESSKSFQSAKFFLDEIDYTHLSNEELLRIIKCSRWLDIRARCDGREYYFQADFLRPLLDKLDDIVTRKILLEKKNNETK